ncbi:MAG: DUF2178 domain-containing protein [Sphingomonadaceae bacterium]|nr:DUF2178 domain-containing protein [Sphingomonadaceae bacterium]
MMSFHEKSRWIALVANLLVWGWYFLAVLGAVRSGVPDTPYLLAMLIPVIIGLIFIHIVGHTVAAIMKPDEANSAMDEREAAIRNRASARAYELLSFGLVIVLGASLYYWNTFIAVNGVLFVFVLAESVRYIIEIAAYRRGLA